MGLVTEDFREWLAGSEPHPETESDFEANPFRRGAARAAQAQLDSHMSEMWHRVTYRVHKWFDDDWEPGSGHGDGLTR